MKSVKQLLVSTLIVTGMSGCLPVEQDPTTNVFDVDAIVKDSNLTSQEKAERIAVIGERLFTPASFMHSAELSDLALTYDETNLRARLYKKMAAPLMVLKGSIGRVSPLVNKFSRDVRKGYGNLILDISETEDIREFFMAPRPRIRTESEAQKLVDEVLTAQSNLRQFIRSVKNEAITLKPMIPYLDKGIGAFWRECQVELGERRAGYHGKYTVLPCPYLGEKTVGLNAGDFEALQHMVAGMEIATILANSYNATGAVSFERFNLRNKSSSFEGKVNFIRTLSALVNCVPKPGLK